jgi:hypothetical protein
MVSSIPIGVFMGKDYLRLSKEFLAPLFFCHRKQIKQTKVIKLDKANTTKTIILM